MNCEVETGKKAGGSEVLYGEGLCHVKETWDIYSR